MVIFFNALKKGGEGMEQIKVSVPSFMKEQIVERTKNLGLSNSEYFRTLADLDIAIQRYQHLVTYINVLFNKINELQIQLGMHATPIQEIPTIKLEVTE